MDRNARKPRKSLNDIARAAGVSKATVSLVLNEKSVQGAISEPTRLRVLEAARRLGYAPRVPRIFAQSVRGMLRHINLVFVNPTGQSEHEFLEPAFYAIAQAAGEEGQLIRATEGIRPEEVNAYCKRFLSSNSDGVVLFTFSFQREPWVDSFVHCGLPVVLFNRDFGPDIACVVMDHKGQASSQVARLLEAGHRRIAGLGQFWGTSLERMEGYRDRLRTAGAYAPELEREAAYSVDAGYEAGRRLLSEAPEITAVFCTTDVTALGMLRAARDSALRVPEDLSIVSMDGYEPGRYSEPPLSSLRYPRAQMGRAAIRLLKQLVAEDAPEPPRVVICGDGVEGGTIASPRSLEGRRAPENRVTTKM